MTKVDEMAEDSIMMDSSEETVESAAAVPSELPPLTLADNTRDSLPQRDDGRYRFVRSIGFGGMKTVLLVYDAEMQREVAMATMPDWKERPPQLVNRFIMEARLTARLEHPNIIPIHDLGRDSSGTPFFTMKYLKGHTLATILRHLKDGDEETVNAYPLVRLLRIYLRICNAIAFAHSQGIIHLDLKPENVHVGEFGEVQVIDWGLARAIARPEDDEKNSPEGDAPAIDDGRTRDGIAKGTPGFMAPEQAAGKNRMKDQRTDIYTLGCILYTILTFEKPLAGHQLKEILRATIKGNIKAPRELENPHWPIPQPLEAICLKAMERFPEDRYQSVAELRQDIIAFSSGYVTSAEEPNMVNTAMRFFQRNYLAVLLTLLGALYLIGFFMLFYLLASGRLTVK